MKARWHWSWWKVNTRAPSANSRNWRRSLLSRRRGIWLRCSIGCTRSRSKIQRWGCRMFVWKMSFHTWMESWIEWQHISTKWNRGMSSWRTEWESKSGMDSIWNRSRSLKVLSVNWKIRKRFLFRISTRKMHSTTTWENSWRSWTQRLWRTKRCICRGCR